MVKLKVKNMIGIVAISAVLFSGVTKSYDVFAGSNTTGNNKATSQNAQNAQVVNVYVNGSKVDFSKYGAEPFIEDGVTYVPFRSILEGLGATIKNDWSTSGYVSGSITKDNKRATIRIYKTDGYSGLKSYFHGTLEDGTDLRYSDSYSYQLPGTYKNVDGRLLVPIRVVSEPFGATVNFDNISKTVFIANTVPVFKLPENTVVRRVPSFIPGTPGDDYIPPTTTTMPIIVPASVVTPTPLPVGYKYGQVVPVDNTAVTTPMPTNPTNPTNGSGYEVKDVVGLTKIVVNGQIVEDFSDNQGSLFASNDKILTTNIFKEDGLYSVIVKGKSGPYIAIEKFDSQWNSVFYKKLQYGTGKNFGGIHYADGNYYMVVGESNLEENSSKKVYTIEKYDKAFNLVGSVSLHAKNTNTQEPFSSGSVKMDYKDGKLIITTARRRFKSSDGLNHQSNFHILVDTKAMKVLNSSASFPVDHVSHSFNQFVRFTDDGIAFLDLGDAYPRAVVLNITNNDDSVLKQSLKLKDIKGEIGDNSTGVVIGGIETAGDGFVAITGETKDLDYAGTYQVYTYGVKKSGGKYTLEARTKLTDISSDKNIYAPKIVKITDEKFMAIWQEIGAVGDNKNKYIDTKICLLDKYGKPVGNIVSKPGYQINQDIMPLVVGNEIITIDRYGDKLMVDKLKID